MAVKSFEIGKDCGGKWCDVYFDDTPNRLSFRVVPGVGVQKTAWTGRGVSSLNFKEALDKARQELYGSKAKKLENS